MYSLTCVQQGNYVWLACSSVVPTTNITKKLVSNLNSILLHIFRQGNEWKYSLLIDKPENIKETEDIDVEEASIANETEMVEVINDVVIDKPLDVDDTEEMGVQETFDICVAETSDIAVEEAADKVLQVDIHG